MEITGDFYRVVTDLSEAPISDYLMHGYTSKWDFYHALFDLACRWENRIGECVEERHDFRRLRFHDTLGGRPDEEWFPKYILRPAPVPEYLRPPTPEELLEEELDRAFGFE